jgi:hypothetical protein
MSSVGQFMSLRKFILVAMLGVWVAGAAFSADSAPKPILPQEFGGWQMSGATRASNDPSAADPANPSLLKEYGFTDLASATYIANDGRKLTIKAARFADATGAYGAFTYYRLPQMITEQIGNYGASLNERVLFFHGNILVDAVFDKLTVMSAAELRELASLLPLASGGNRNLPALAGYLPTQARISNSIKYVVGPIGLTKINAPLPPELVDFNAGAEVAQANYQTSSGIATLMVISYPTPQIAAQNLQHVDAAHQPDAQPPSSSSPTGANLFFDKRTGPILVIAAGQLSPSEAKSFLRSVNYEADVTWNQNTYASKKDNIANLIVNVIVLCGIIGGLAIVAGIAFGGLRVLIRILLPEQVQRQREEMEFISLHLSDKND